jgi:SAM-dependent methyltransferase
LDSAERSSDIVHIIKSKPSLLRLYGEYYSKFAAALSRCPESGLALEIGSGMGFSKEYVPSLETSDVIPYPGIEHLVDATKMPFQSSQLRGIFMLNVFHHIPDVGAFLSEASRCLMSGGRIFIIDQHHGWISRWILRYVHHEGYDSKVTDWPFTSEGPLTSANGALAWIVFKRDEAILTEKYPNLKLLYYRTHTPFRYWLAGGLKKWSILPLFLFNFASRLDSLLIHFFPEMGSFVEVELVRI